MKQVITAMDVISDVDLDHPIATIKRLPGGAGYEVILFGESYVPFHRDPQTGFVVRDRESFDSVEAAVEWVNLLEQLVVDDPSLITPAAVHANALVAAGEDRIRELEAELVNTNITLSKNADERRRLEEALAAKGG